MSQPKKEKPNVFDKESKKRKCLSGFENGGGGELADFEVASPEALAKGGGGGCLGEVSDKR